MSDLKPKPGDPLHQPGQGSRVGQLGAKRGGVPACGDRAVVELCAQRSVCPASESDLICVLSHWDIASQLVVGRRC